MLWRIHGRLLRNRLPYRITGPIAAMCEPPYPMSFSDNNRTLVILLETSYGMSSTIWAMKKQLTAILQAILLGSTADWFGNFIFIPFDSRKRRGQLRMTAVFREQRGRLVSTGLFEKLHRSAGGNGQHRPRAMSRQSDMSNGYAL